MNLNDFVAYWARWRPDHPALIFEEGAQSWGALQRTVEALALGLAAQGVRQGDRVGLLMGNRPELAQLTLAVLRLGAIVVPLNFRLTTHELRPLLEDCGCRLVVSEGKYLPLLESHAADLALRIFATEGTDCQPFARLLIETGCVPHVEVAADDGAFICYTSGTTGRQKGALLTHRSVIHPGQAKVLAEGLSWRDRILVAVPLVYTGAMISCFMQLAVYAGATMVLDADFNPDRYLATIERQRISALTTVPVIWERLLNSPEFATRDLSSLISAAAGGAPVRPDLLAAYRARGVALIQVYGLTEASGLVTTLRPEDAAGHPGCAGRAIMGTQIRIADAAGRSVPTGEVAEVLIRGPHVMREYWNRPEDTAANIRDGWLRSGDLGLMDEEGYLKIVDRAKDMIISGGMNVYPAEIEPPLAAIDGVVELAVIGVPDAQWGEVPLIILHTQRDARTVIADIEAVGRKVLAGYKRPRHVVITAEPLPRTFSGKLAKAELRRRYPEAPDDAHALFRSVGNRVAS